MGSGAIPCSWEGKNIPASQGKTVSVSVSLDSVFCFGDIHPGFPHEAEIIKKGARPLFSSLFLRLRKTCLLYDFVL